MMEAEKEIYCWQCGKKASSKTSFCSECGARLFNGEDQLPAATTVTNQMDSIKKKLSKVDKKVFYSVGAIIIVIIGILFYSLQKEKPSEIVELFINETVESNWDQANTYALEEFDYLKMRNLSQRFPLSGSPYFVDELQLIKEEKSGDKATVTYKLIFTNGRRENVTFELLKNEGKWLITEYREEY